MTPAAPGMVVAIHVRNIAVSRRFYQALGFADQSSELDAGSAFAALRYGECGLLLAPGLEATGTSRLPLLLGVPVDDVDAVIRALLAGGFDVSGPAGSGAPGGQATLRDPDGNTVVIGKRTRAGGLAGAVIPAAWRRRSLFGAAAAVLTTESPTAGGCQVRDVDGTSCGQDVAVKLADSAGDAVWACLDHADEILVTVRGAFIASQADQGLAAFKARRRGRRQPGQD
jgi:predicted enzyme related to lactoylglutathione lyase